MTEQWLKFVRRKNKKEQIKILEVAEKITLGQLEYLDIDSIKGSKNKFRCRVGNVRIIFSCKLDGKYFIKGIGNRGKIYKRKK